MSIPHSASSNQRLLSPSNSAYPINPYEDYSQYGSLLRDPTTVSTNDIGLPKVLKEDGDVGEQTMYQVDIVNDELARKSMRSELANKNACLTRRWQTALVICLVILAFAIALGGLAYYITLPKVITQPYLLYGASCYMNSRSCDATRQLWCPAGTCICTGNYGWNATIQNCTCSTYYVWKNVKCQSYGYYGDPCDSVVLCRPTLKCSPVVNQTFTTGQSICVCDSTTYLDAVTTSSTYRTCIPRLTYNANCKTNTDCQNWLGLACTSVSSSLLCQCSSTSYWNGTICKSNALGWQPCGGPISCDTTRGLTCNSSSSTCQCDIYSYWDNITTLYCQPKKTYAVSCAFDFQCNTTVSLSCPSTSTGCICPTAWVAPMCDCLAANFWDGQRCTARHIFNGTCPGQYACASNLVCYLGHCICPGNMAWNNVTANTCACLAGTTWNNILNTCQ